MPVYEFYCADCHTIFNFLSRRANTETKPDCPRCGSTGLERQVSGFAISRGRTEDGKIEGMPDIDEAKLEKVLMGMAGEIDGMNENDPRQMARLMRKLSDATGMNLGSGFEEAIRRLEAGEAPEKIEAEMGDAFADDNMENIFHKGGIKGLRQKYTPPAHDDTLHPLEEQ